MKFKSLALIVALFSLPLSAMDGCRERFAFREAIVQPKPSLISALAFGDLDAAAPINMHARTPVLSQTSVQTQSLADAKQTAEASVADRARIIAAAFARLPKNANANAAADGNVSRFEQKIADEMPDELIDHIAEIRFKGNYLQDSKMSAEDRLDIMKQLLPCFVVRQPHYPSVKDLHQIAKDQLNQSHFIVRDQLEEQGNPYIIGVCGFWAFSDEPSKFRLCQGPVIIGRDEDGQMMYASDLATYFGVSYEKRVLPTEPNEFIVVLYSDGFHDLMLNTLAFAQLKKMTNDQIKFCLKNVRTNTSGYFSDEEYEQFKDLPSMVRRCIRENYEVARNYRDLWLRRAVYAADGALGFYVGRNISREARASRNLWNANRINLLSIAYGGFTTASFFKNTTLNVRGTDIFPIKMGHSSARNYFFMAAGYVVTAVGDRILEYLT